MTRSLNRIALINPDNPLQDVNPGMASMFDKNKERVKPWAAPSLSLLTIAALTPDDIEIEYIDERFEAIDFNRKYDLVGLTAMTHQAHRAYKIAAIFKQMNIPVVMGGIHASIMPDEALQHVDTVFVGESEALWPEYIHAFKSETEEIIYKNEKIIDLSVSPIPRYDLIKFNLFRDTSHYFNIIPLQATRGCPHDCNFCVATKYYGRKLRKKSVPQIIKELEFLLKTNNEFLIFFADDNLFVDRKFAKSLLRELIPFRIKFMTQSDIQVSNDPELLELAYLSGCEMIFIGFESVVVESLREINNNQWKRKQAENYSESIKKIQEYGIVVFGGFIIGFMHDQLSTFHKIKEFNIQNNIPGSFTILTPLPGSRVYEELKTENRLYNDVFWQECSLYSLLFKHDHMTRKEAENALIDLYDEVFSVENSLKRTHHMIYMYKNLPPRWTIT